ncbi:MAG: ankyrin repeat domain-containing protein, partial [Silvanigrellaceae bacterium]|nr:ankyrin repeat domain-containing protein [Silvanigrellaceae bacterium]
MKDHGYINPEQIFQFPSKDHFGGGHYITFTDKDWDPLRISNLESNIEKIFSGLATATKEVSVFIRFWRSIKVWLHNVWQSLTDILKDLRSENNLASHMDLAENIDNIVEEKNITENAQLIHKFNSQPSPLIAIIYDEALSEERKLELINIIAREKKYGQGQLNIDIAGVNKWEPDQGSPLAHAVDIKSLPIVQLLITKGANVNNIDKSSMAPIHRAIAKQSSLEIINCLIKHKADLTLRDEKGQSALHLAVVRDNLEAVKALVEAQPEMLHSTDNLGNTPLHYVKNAKIAEYLISQKANLESVNIMGNTPLHEIARRQCKLIEPMPWEKVQDVSAESRQYLAVFEEILKHSGKVINYPNRFGYTPLHMALQINTELTQGLQSGNINSDTLIEKIKRLLAAGADPAMVTHQALKLTVGNKFDNPLPNMSALLMLFYYFNKRVTFSDKVVEYSADIVTALLKNDAQHTIVNLVNSDSDSALILAIRRNDVPGVKALLQQGAKVSYSTAGVEISALHEAISLSKHYPKDSTLITSELLKYDADIHHKMLHKISLTSNLVKSADSLSDQAIALIFSDDNIISKKAKEMGLTITPENHLEMLREVWQQLKLQPIA